MSHETKNWGIFLTIIILLIEQYEKSDFRLLIIKNCDICKKIKNMFLY